MQRHKVVPRLLMAAGLTLPVAATVEFLSHVGITSLATSSGTPTPVPSSTPPPVSSTPAPSSTPPPASSTPAPSSTPPPVSSTPAPSSTQTPLSSGTFTGVAAPGYFGPVQAKLTVKGGKITHVSITAPQDNPTSAYINSQVVPMLQSETLKAQSANINGISGATVTSEFYYQSLVSALKQAHL